MKYNTMLELAAAAGMTKGESGREYPQDFAERFYNLVTAQRIEYVRTIIDERNSALAERNIAEDSLRILWQSLKSASAAIARTEESIRTLHVSTDPLSKLYLDTRTANALAIAGFRTTGQLLVYYADHGVDGLVRIKGVGRNGSKEVIEAIERFKAEAA